MRKLLLTVAAAGALLAGGSLLTSSANAMPLGGPAIGAVADEMNLAQDVRLICRRYWNGFRWRTRCVETRPRIIRRPYAPRRFYRPRGRRF